MKQLKLAGQIYLTANILIGLFIGISAGFSGETIGLVFGIFVLTLFFSLPSAFLLYYFLLLAQCAFSVFARWLSYTLLLLVAALLPYFIFGLCFPGELADKELVIILYLSEGSAFGASLLNCLAIHRHFKTFTYETE